MSVAEEVAWRTLRTLRDEGIHLVRQHKIGRFTVDFASRKQRVAIEIDGGVHDLPGRREYDSARQAQLEGIGWRFIRIPANRVHDNLFLLTTVRAAISPSPSRGGGRGRDETPPNACAHNESQTSDAAASPHPLIPSSQEEEIRQAFAKNLHRRTRANRKLPARAKP
jgi:very-short-patch-repair endonuclease